MERQHVAFIERISAVAVEVYRHAAVLIGIHPQRDFTLRREDHGSGKQRVRAERGVFDTMERRVDYRPPADSEYAVEPVGVLNITPSARSLETSVSPQ